jgi:hypothetical protein
MQQLTQKVRLRMRGANGDKLDCFVRCSICDAGCTDGDDPKHLQLYCNGSEGITVCLDCRMTLTEVARGMMRVAHASRMAGYKACKRVQKAKAAKS